MPEEVRTYSAIVTDKGAAKITAHLMAGTKLDIVYAAAGDGGGVYYVPDISQTELRHECWRGEIASAEINAQIPSMIDVKFILPEEAGPFTVREASFIDRDGDTIAIANTPDTEKVPLSRGVSGRLTVLIHLLLKDAASLGALHFAVDPSLDTVSREEMDRTIETALSTHNADPESHPDLREAIANAGGAGGTTSVAITIPAAGWKESGVEDYPKMVDVPCEAATADCVPEVALDPAAVGAAAEAGLCPTVEALDGALRFWAEKQSAIDLPALAVLARAEAFALHLTVTIPAEGWTDTEGDWPKTVDVPCEGVRADQEPRVVLDVSSLKTAAEAGLCPTVEAMDGALRLWAKAAPAKALTAAVALRTGSAGGGPGEIDVATKAEVNNALEQVFGAN